MKRHPLVVLGVALAVLPACGDYLEPSAATVGRREIPAAEIDATVKRCRKSEQFRQLATQQGGAEQLAHQFEQGFLSQMIRSEVLAIEAEERGVAATAEDVKSRIDEFRTQFRNEEDFREQLREQCLTFEQLETLTAAQLHEQRLRSRIVADVTPSEAELRSYYRDNIAQYRTTEVQHILVKQESLAARLSRRLRSAPNDEVEHMFADLSRRYSIDKANAEDAGNIGVVGPGQLTPPFEDAMNRLAVGEVSEPVQTDFGWHVIRVIDRQTEPFSQVRSEIVADIAGSEQERSWQKWLKGAYEEAGVEVDPRYGELDLATQRVVDPTAEDFPASEEGGGSPASRPSPEPER